MRIKIALLSGFIILLIINGSIYNKEKHLSEGKIAYLELAPVDPRSLMQGDYMALRFALASEIKVEHHKQSEKATDGFVIVELNESNVAHFSRIDNGTKLADNELRMHYRIRNTRVKFATNAFFFQEGKAELFSKAKYGLFRVSGNGDLLLSSMHDENLNKLGSEPVAQIEKQKQQG